MNIEPVNSRILVQPKKAEEKTKGGLYIPEEAKEKSQEGTVVAIPQMEKCPVAVGDIVIYESYAGTKIKVNNETHVLLKAEDILAKKK